MTTCFSDCQPGEFLDYGLFIPGSEFRPLPFSESSSENGDGYSDDALSGEAAAEAAVEAIVKKSELEEKFDVVSGGEKYISFGDATALARELGFAPSLADMERVRQKNGDNIDMDLFKGLLKEYAHSEDTRDHLISVFRHYDSNGSGQLSKKQIRNLLSSFGEPLTEKEIDDLFSKLGVSSDPVNYEEVITRMLK
eukprot:Lankesteria_metandrocarpae@DN6226_c0_g1_i1.p1